MESNCYATMHDLFFWSKIFRPTTDFIVMSLMNKLVLFLFSIFWLVNNLHFVKIGVNFVLDFDAVE